MAGANRSVGASGQPNRRAGALPHGAARGLHPLRAIRSGRRHQRTRRRRGHGGAHARALAGIAGPARSLAAVRPAVVLLAHTGASYVNGFAQEPGLIARLASHAGAPALTAAQAISTALRHLGAKTLALGTPYPEAIGALGRAYWEAAGFEIVAHQRLEGVTNIYAESAERAYQLARQADAPGADAVLLSGTGLPTADVLETLEHDLGKPVISSVQASLWHALRLAGVRQSILGYGRLLREV